MAVFGIEKLRAAAIVRASELVDEIMDEVDGDSPIEKLLMGALSLRVALRQSDYRDISLVRTEAEEKNALARKGDLNNGYPTMALALVIRPQAILEGRRVDFLIHALDWRVADNPRWRRLIIECDGHEFHERTKEQAKRDRSRDRAALMGKYETFRFTGSEIWNDPELCAEEITNWAFVGWGFR